MEREVKLSSIFLFGFIHTSVTLLLLQFSLFFFPFNFTSISMIKGALLHHCWRRNIQKLLRRQTKLKILRKSLEWAILCLSFFLNLYWHKFKNRSSSTFWHQIQLNSINHYIQFSLDTTFTHIARYLPSDILNHSCRRFQVWKET